MRTIVRFLVSGGFIGFLSTGCGSPGGSGGGGTGAGVTSGLTAVTTDTSTSDGATTSASSSSTTSTTGTAMGTPCNSLKDPAEPNPTPGVCQGNVAVTCGADGYLAQEACAGGATCTTYELKEWKWNGMLDTPAYQKGRTVTWAGCEPVDTQPCAMVFDGNDYKATSPPHCDGPHQLVCRTPTTPDTNGWFPQRLFGTTSGWLISTACGPTEKCAGSETDGVLTCIDTATPACDGTEPFCSAQGIVGCQGTWESSPGYRATTPCPADSTCREGSMGPLCVGNTETTCDPATFGPTRCETDGASMVTCVGGFTTHSSCATCEAPNNQMVPCRCDTTFLEEGYSDNPTTGLQCQTTSLPLCIPAVDADCDPAIDADSCVGNVAHRCVGHWEDVDCGSQGLVCGVASGLAGCKRATAPACDVGTYQSHCSGTTMVACCACASAELIFGPPIAPCVPGFEVESDCAALGPEYICSPPHLPLNDIACLMHP